MILSARKFQNSFAIWPILTKVDEQLSLPYFSFLPAKSASQKVGRKGREIEPNRAQCHRILRPNGRKWGQYVDNFLNWFAGARFKTWGTFWPCAKQPSAIFYRGIVGTIDSSSRLSPWQKTACRGRRCMKWRKVPSMPSCLLPSLYLFLFPP